MSEPNSNEPTKIIHGQKLADQSILNGTLLTKVTKLLMFPNELEIKTLVVQQIYKCFMGKL